MKSWLQDNDVEIYSEHNEGKSVVADLLKPQRMKSVNI